VTPIGEILSPVLDWLRENQTLVRNVVLLTPVVALAYVALMGLVVVRMSPDYFVAKKPGEESWRLRHPVARILGHVVKNLLGLVFLVAGIAMLFLPGQGVLTILVAIGLLDFPGKRRLERSIVRRPSVHRAINAIRARAGQPPLIVPDEEETDRAARKTPGPGDDQKR
jgi:hypothetical protein